jgi:tetratricopeptide (TPR) repeat protein
MLYLAKAVWPLNLSPFYPHPQGSLAAWQIAAALLLLVAITALAFFGNRRRYLLVGWFWFLGTLVPMIGLLQVNRQAMADRYAYISFIGLFILTVWGISDIAEQHDLPPILVRSVAIAVLAALTILTWRQIGYWSDNLTLWTHAIEVTDNNYLAENIVGSMLMDQGQGDEALPHLQAATQMNPSDPSAYMAIGTYDQQHGDALGALQQYQRTIALTDSAVQRNLWLRSTTFARMGSAYRQLRNLPQARASYQKALEIDSGNGQIWLALGIVTAQAGDNRSAIDAYSRSLKLQPSDVGYLLLAHALDQTGQSSQAEEARADARRVSRDLPVAERRVDQIFADPVSAPARP